MREVARGEGFRCPWLTKSAAEFGYEMLQLNDLGRGMSRDRRGLRR